MTTPSVRRAYVAGTIATFVVTAMMRWISPLISDAELNIPAMVGTMLGQSWIAGVAAHFLAGIVVLPALYVGSYRWLMGTPAVRGLLFGLCLWLVSQALIAPGLGAGWFSANVGGLPVMLDSLLLNLTYGCLLGTMTGRPVRTTPAWMHPTELEAHWRRPSWVNGGGAPTHWRIR
jgi:hypothetical protein